MTIESVTAALSRWLVKVAANVLPRVRIAPSGGLGRMMSGFFGIDPTAYNVWDELGFLAEPTVRNFVEPSIARMLSAIPAERLDGAVNAYVDALLARTEGGRHVNVFGVRIGANAFEDLKRMLNEQTNE